MKTKVTLLLLVSISVYACYDPEDDVTTLKNVEFNLIGSEDNILADGFSEYSFEIKLPGVKNGNPKSISLNSTWGVWVNDSSSANFAIEYSSSADAFIDTLKLKAAREIGPFSIQLIENSLPIKTLNLEANPNYPSHIQVISDSINLKLVPGNTAQLKALFFNEIGFPSDDIKYEFNTEANVKIFPNEVFIQSSETVATLQILTNTVLDTIKIYGRIPELDWMQPTTDTLRIAIIN